ncbi:MAG: UpxY family transcription antiterminator [Balneolales bacterium]
MFWYALYTRPRFEKKVRDALSKNGFEVWLPLRKELRQWSDRKKWVEEPLFRSYVFVKTDYAGLPSVSRTNGVVAPVTFNGKPSIIRDYEIKAINLVLSGPNGFDVDDIHFTKDEEVHITHGPLKGFTGNWISWKGTKRVSIEIQQLQKCLIVEVPAAYIEKAKD